jgi:hypothetical protein
MSEFVYWNPTRKLDISDFSGKLFWKIFSMICTSPTHSMHHPKLIWGLDALSISLILVIDDNI